MASNNLDHKEPVNMENGEDGVTEDENEDKQQLIEKVHQLQTTLDDLWNRVDSVKEENIKLKTENEVLEKYIYNLIDSSTIFQSIQPKTKVKSKK